MDKDVIDLSMIHGYTISASHHNMLICSVLEDVSTNNMFAIDIIKSVHLFVLALGRMSTFYHPI